MVKPRYYISLQTQFFLAKHNLKVLLYSLQDFWSVPHYSGTLHMTGFKKQNSELDFYSSGYFSETHKFRSSHRRSSVKKATTLFKKRLWHRSFHVNFGKFLRTSFLQSTSGRLLLQVNLQVSMMFSSSVTTNWLIRISTIFIYEKLSFRLCWAPHGPSMNSRKQFLQFLYYRQMFILFWNATKSGTPRFWFSNYPRIFV